MKSKECASGKELFDDKECCSPVVTVIVPVYNVEPYLRRCVGSILAQTFKQFDLILVDDGSSDGSGRICDEYKEADSRVFVIHKEYGGVSAARNAGLDWAFSESSSEWITFIDSDDWVHPKYLEILFSAAEKYNEDIVISRHKRVSREELPPFSEHTTQVWETEKYFVTENTNAIVIWGKLLRKKYYEGIRFPVGKIHEDEFTTYKILFQKDHLVVVDQPLYAYIQTKNSIMRGKWCLDRLDVLKAMEEQVVFFKKHHFYAAAKKKYGDILLLNQTSQTKILESEDLTNREKKQYIHTLKKELRRLLIQYRHTGWCSFRESRSNRDVYMNAFPGLGICRAVWSRIKPFIRLIIKS